MSEIVVHGTEVAGGNTIPQPGCGRHRNWCFTSFEEKDPIEELGDNTKGIVYCKFQREMSPTTEKLHWQGLVLFKNAQALSWFKKRCPTWHVERMISFEGSMKYCEKKETRVSEPVEWGEKPIGKPGYRSDLHNVVEAIEEGKEIADIISEEPATLKYISHMEKLQNAQYRGCDKKPIWTTVDWDWDEVAMEMNGLDYYIKPKGRFWNGYKGQMIVLLTEDVMSLGIQPAMRGMKLDVEVKGGSTKLRSMFYYELKRYIDLYTPKE